MFSPNRTFLEIVEEVSKQNKNLHSDFLKVKKHLKDFAISRNTLLKNLAFVDVGNINNLPELNKNLQIYLYRNLNERYVRETISRLRRIIKAISTVTEVAEEDQTKPNINKLSMTDMLAIPEVIEENLDLFPRNFSFNRQASEHTRAWRNNPSVRKYLYLTDCGQELLKVFINVANKNDIRLFEQFFTVHKDNVLDEINKYHPLFFMLKIKQCYYQLRRKTGIKVPRKIRQSLYFEQLPEKLKIQCKVLIENAQKDIDPNSYMHMIAREHGTEIRKLSNRSVNVYIESILYFLGKYKFDNFLEIDVRDFLRLESKEIFDEDGLKIVVKYNPYIEKIRQGERLLITKSKRKGFDTPLFSRFLTAIKAVAAYNHFFKYHRPFNAVYKRFLDKECTKRKRLEKKQIFDLGWIDNEIRRLFDKYKSITDSKTFIISRKAGEIYRTRNNLTFCFFYVILVMLRYSGIRQQLIRHSKYGENISFDKEGNLKLSWLKNITKNNKNQTGFIDRKLHFRTHKILLETLDLYYLKIYPYARSIAKDDKQDGCFFYVNKNCQTSNFSKERSSHLGSYFSKWGTRFLSFRDRLDENCKYLNAHILRGHCADWLHFELKVSRRSTADFIGDMEETLVEHYLDLKNSHSMTPALDEANNYLKLIEDK